MIVTSRAHDSSSCRMTGSPCDADVGDPPAGSYKKDKQGARKGLTI